jgi:tetratricopeptide (TPR) repeat protein
MKCIEAAIGVSDVLIAVISNQWIAAEDKGGEKRIHNPEDPVRKEIAFAIKLNVPILPVLVGGADMVSPNDLPDEIRPLARQNAAEIDNARYDDDFKEFLTAIRKMAADHEREKMVNRPQITPEILLALAKHYLHDKDYPSARRFLDEAQANNPRSAAVCVGLAQCLQLEAFSQIVRRNFGFAEELLIQGEAQIDDALRYDNTDPDIFVQAAYVRKDIAQMYARVEKMREAAIARAGARTHFKMALGVDECHVSAMNGLASIAALEQKWDEALEWLGRALEIRPDYMAARQDLVQVHYGRFLAAENDAARKAVGEDILAALKDLRDMMERPGTEKLPDEAMTSLGKIAAYVTGVLCKLA